jgi:hypothetical protein
MKTVLFGWAVVTNATYDVFVSYSSADIRHAVEIDSVLRDKGLKTFLRRRNLAGVCLWVPALGQAIGPPRLQSCSPCRAGWEKPSYLK